MLLPLQGDIDSICLTQGVASLCPGLWACCPFRALFIYYSNMIPRVSLRSALGYELAALSGRCSFIIPIWFPGCRFALPWAMSLLPLQGVIAGWKPNERIALFHFPILLAFKWFLFQLRILFLLLTGWKPNERIAQGKRSDTLGNVVQPIARPEWAKACNPRYHAVNRQSVNKYLSS